jgi:Tol biopolymer transport system component
LITNKTTVSNICDWSRDGKWILYGLVGDGTQSDLWLVPAAGDAQPQPFLQTKAAEGCGQFSPDGKWVAYPSDESGLFQTYIRGFPKGEKFQISRDGGIIPRWRGDGKELFFRSSDGNLMAVDIRAGGAIELGIPAKLFSVTEAGSLSTAIGYSPSADGKKFLMSIQTQTGAAEPMTAVLNWMSLLKR